MAPKKTVEFHIFDGSMKKQETMASNSNPVLQITDGSEKKQETMASNNNPVLQITDGSEKKQETMASNNKLVLVSSEGDSFEIKQSAAIQSKTISNMVEAGCDVNAIHLSNIKSKTLAQVVEFCNKHAEIHNPEDLREWDEDFSIMDRQSHIDLLVAAHYLHIKTLSDLTTQVFADMIKGKSPGTIRRIYNIENDLSSDEEEKIFNDHAWAFRGGFPRNR